jgi:hypothetical protein
MKKVLVYVAALAMSAAMLAPQGLSAQQRVGNVVKVQGHVHELLTKQMHERRRAPQKLREPVGNVTNINPKDVQCWVGCIEMDPKKFEALTVDTAYLLVKWTDGKANSRPVGSKDSILLWGYQWVSSYNSLNPADTAYNPYTVTKYSIDMLRAVANFDCRFSVLLQNTGGGNFAIGGFGYNFLADDRVPLRFDLAGAQGLVSRDTIQFHYTGYDPNCLAPYNQFVEPTVPVDTILVEQAIAASQNTGIIKHPLDAAYGYPAYDYDFWVLTDPGNINFEWQAGWYYNYWGYYTRAGLSGGFNYGNNITTDVLSNNTTNYFVFAPADYLIPVNMDGYYSARKCCETACTACTPSTSKRKKR